MKKNTAVRYNIILLIFFLPLITEAGTGSETIFIDSLKDQQTEPLKQLRSQIAVNLRLYVKKTDAQPLRFYKYKIKETDKFYPVIARLSQDEDTVSSLNNIINPNDLEPGQEILIPDARGLFVSEKELSGYESARAQKIVYPDTDQVFYFLPGQKRNTEERSLFRGEGFIYPVEDGKISSPYGMRKDPFSKRQVFHGGIDIAASVGTAVYASRSGHISFASVRGGYGNLIVINHSHGYETLYGHLSDFAVKDGAAVKKGDLIGHVGTTGRSTGPHLHFELRKNGFRTRPDLTGRKNLSL
jgi:murein DD-endopeptidase MepM/ murein hydrolase activator NlpD